MKITIFGTGYVGLVTGTCLAEVGNHVTCVDIDANKIEGLNKGIIPIYEPGLEPLVRSNHAERRLQFTTDAAAAISAAQIIFIAVGTPPDEDGSADLSHVLAVAKTIGRYLSCDALVVNKSTVPVGTADRVRNEIYQQLGERGIEIECEVASNPEFLKEGDAVKDCMRPDRIVVGSDSAKAIELLKQLYAPFNRNHERLVLMDVRSAELTKYAANAMLATKISFMNEIANIAERVGADVELVRQGIGSDPRIGYAFIYPGAGYGGSCFPKDVQALDRTARQHGYTPQILDAVERVNQQQKDKLVQMIDHHYDGNIVGKIFAVWGLSFKPNTDDMRDAPSRRVLEQLWQRGAIVRAHDPEALHEAARIFGERSDLILCEQAEHALVGADSLIIITEWMNFRSPDFVSLSQVLRDKVIFDGRNIYDPKQVETHGLAYYGIGRGRAIKRGNK